MPHHHQLAPPTCSRPPSPSEMLSTRDPAGSSDTPYPENKVQNDDANRIVLRLLQDSQPPDGGIDHGVSSALREELLAEVDDGVTSAHPGVAEPERRRKRGVAVDVGTQELAEQEEGLVSQGTAGVEAPDVLLPGSQPGGKSSGTGGEVLQRREAILSSNALA